MHSAPRFPSQTPQMKNAGSILPAFHTTRAKLSNLLSQKAISFPSIDYPGSVQLKLHPIENIASMAKGFSKEARKHISIILRATRQNVKCIMEYQVPNKEATLTAEISPIILILLRRRDVPSGTAGRWKPPDICD